MMIIKQHHISQQRQQQRMKRRRSELPSLQLLFMQQQQQSSSSSSSSSLYHDNNVVFDVTQYKESTTTNNARNNKRILFSSSTNIFWLLSIQLVISMLMTTTSVTSLATTSSSISIDPDLPLGDINLLIVTDVHSWCGGQRHLYNTDSTTTTGGGGANYGDILSFVQHMKHYIYNNNNQQEQEQQVQRDIWFVMNGDYIDGTGLSLVYNVHTLLSILERMQYDIINIGNHELYYHTIIQQLVAPGNIFEWYQNKYLTSNVRYTSTINTDSNLQPLGSNYRILKGQYYNLLTFGFLYNMGNASDPMVTVVEVENVIKETWFINVIQDIEQYDAILIMAHMHVLDTLCTVLLNAIRDILITTTSMSADPMITITIPIQFITGHTHIRDYHIFIDNNSTSTDMNDKILLPATSMEAGHYLDTLGFVSFPSKQTIANFLIASSNASNSTRSSNTTPGIAPISTITPYSIASSLFKYKYIDANVNVLASTLGLDPTTTFPTEDGIQQTNFITNIQNELGLNDIIGCNKQTYYLNRTVYAYDSLWGFFVTTILQSQSFLKYFDSTTSNIAVLMGTGGWRYDLYSGSVRVDDIYSISPFNNTFIQYMNIPGNVILQLNTTLNDIPPKPYNPTPYLPNFLLALTDQSSVEMDTLYTLVLDSYGDRFIVNYLLDIVGNESIPIVPIPVSSELTTISVWMNYFIESTTSKSSKYCKDEPNTNTHKTHHPPSTTSSHHGGTPSSSVSTNSNVDAIRLLFVSIAIVTMIIFTIIIIRQKGRMFHQLVEQREMATSDAMRDYYGPTNNNNSNCYTTDDDDDDDHVNNSNVNDRVYYDSDNENDFTIQELT